MNTQPEIHPTPTLTCILARPGRYELVWHAPAPSRPTLRGGKSIPLSRPVYREIIDILSARAPEVGGLLLGPRNNRLVTHFLLDETGTSSPTSFSWDHASLNRRMRPYLGCGLNIKGMVHSHPSGLPGPTDNDRNYLVRLLSRPRNRTKEFYFPVLCDGRLQPFIVTSDSLSSPTRWAVTARIILF